MKKKHVFVCLFLLLSILMASCKSMPSMPIYTATISVTGDLMVHKWQLDDARKKGGGLYSFDYVFEYIREYLSNSDYTVGNLETTFPGDSKEYTDFPVFGSPDSFGEAIKNAGYDMVTTANNHCNDKGEKGIIRTLDTLDRLGVEHIGTYRSQAERDSIFIKNINGITFAFIAYTYSTNGWPLTEGKDYLANILNNDNSNANLIKDIKTAKVQNPDFIIVLPHIGDEYVLTPQQDYVDLINSMFLAGADIVLASHPHVIQPMEYVEIYDKNGIKRRCFVAYSLGNFISSQRIEPRDAGLILNLTFEKREGKKAFIKSISYIPTWVQFMDSTGEYNIRVVSVYDTLKAILDGYDVKLSKTDIERVTSVYSETINMISGKKNKFIGMQNEHIFK